MKEGKRKGKEKLKRTTSIKNEAEKPSCYNYMKEAHDEDHSCKLCLQLRPKSF